MLRLYSIRDLKVGFMSPFSAHNDASAQRDFILAAEAKEANVVNQYLADKDLYFIGTFDEETGAITSEPRRLIEGVAVKATLDAKAGH